MAQVLADRRVADMSVRDLQELVEALAEKVLRDYEVRPRDYFIDEEGWLCFRNEQAYAEYLDKQGKPAGEVKACFIEDGMRVVYSDEKLSSEISAQIERVHREVETGVSLVEHAALREKLGV